jgi:hypothetical protein
MRITILHGGMNTFLNILQRIGYMEEYYKQES